MNRSGTGLSHHGITIITIICCHHKIPRHTGRCLMCLCGTPFQNHRLTVFTHQNHIAVITAKWLECFVSAALTGLVSIDAGNLHNFIITAILTTRLRFLLWIPNVRIIQSKCIIRLSKHPVIYYNTTTAWATGWNEVKCGQWSQSSLAPLPHVITQSLFYHTWSGAGRIHHSCICCLLRKQTASSPAVFDWFKADVLEAEPRTFCGVRARQKDIGSEQ